MTAKAWGAYISNGQSDVSLLTVNRDGSFATEVGAGNQSLDFLALEQGPAPHVFQMSDNALVVFFTDHSGNATWVKRTPAGAWSAPTVFDAQSFWVMTRGVQHGDTIYFAVQHNDGTNIIYRFIYGGGNLTLAGTSSAKPGPVLGMYYDTTNNLLHWWYDTASSAGNGQLVAYHPTTLATVYGPTAAAQGVEEGNSPGNCTDMDGSGANFFATNVGHRTFAQNALQPKCVVWRVTAGSASYTTLVSETVPDATGFPTGSVLYGGCIWDGAALNLFVTRGDRLGTVTRTGVNTYGSWQHLSSPSSAPFNDGQFGISDLGGNGDLMIVWSMIASGPTNSFLKFKVRIGGAWGSTVDAASGSGISASYPSATRHVVDLTVVAATPITGRFNNSTFDKRQDDRFFDEKGESVQWLAARKCSCSPEGDPNRANPSCLVCFGIGTFYADPTWVTGLVANISNSKMLLESGVGLPGDLVFSAQLMDDARLADRDIIKLDWQGGEAYEGELVKRSANTFDKLIYDAVEIQAVTQSDPDLGTIASFVEGTDYTHAVNSDTLTWIGVTPATGSLYSVRYRPRFAYIVFIPPAERRERGTNLGQRVILKKKHLVLAK